MYPCVVTKHLDAYFNIVKVQNQVLVSLNAMERFDGQTLENFTRYSQEIRQFISEYQGWVNLLVGAHGLTDESSQLFHQINQLLQSNLDIIKLLQPKIELYMNDLTKLIKNQKPKKHSTPHYRFSQSNYYLNLNI